MKGTPSWEQAEHVAHGSCICGNSAAARHKRTNRSSTQLPMHPGQSLAVWQPGVANRHRQAPQPPLHVCLLPANAQRLPARLQDLDMPSAAELAGAKVKHTADELAEGETMILTLGEFLPRSFSAICAAHPACKACCRCWQRRLRGLACRRAPAKAAGRCFHGVARQFAACDAAMRRRSSTPSSWLPRPLRLLQRTRVSWMRRAT